MALSLPSTACCPLLVAAVDTFRGNQGCDKCSSIKSSPSSIVICSGGVPKTPPTCAFFSLLLSKNIVCVGGIFLPPPLILFCIILPHQSQHPYSYYPA